MKWAKKWRLKLSMVKTEFCLFSLDNGILEEARTFKFCVEGQELKYNQNPKILGVTLDEKLKFENHIEIIERKASRSLELLRKVKETEMINAKCMLQLFKAIAVPQLEYAAPVWQIGNCSGLERVQRKGLAMCLGLPGTAGIESLQVEAEVKPLEIRREELAIRQAARVMMKDNEECIKVSWDKFVESEMVENKVSPFGKMIIQVADMTTNTGVSLHSLEKEFTCQDSLQPSKSKPEYWNCLGSSKSRTRDQESLSRDIIGGLLDQCDTDTTVAFRRFMLGKPGTLWGRGLCFFTGHDRSYTIKTTRNQPWLNSTWRISCYKDGY